ncbi:hypothetical protein K1W54_12465 [Micromonospora sp. CPCC 205371]|nr:hypothetical protein [Micromonospora sp. CPCC 205371]
MHKHLDPLAPVLHQVIHRLIQVHVDQHMIVARQRDHGAVVRAAHQQRLRAVHRPNLPDV